MNKKQANQITIKDELLIAAFVSLFAKLVWLKLV